MKRKLSDIIPAHYNPRSISDESLQGLVYSIRKFGLVQPLVINTRTGNLVGGHQRLKACQILGIEEVEVHEIDISYAEEKALNVALNNKDIQGDFTESLQDILKEIRAEIPEDYDKLLLKGLEDLFPHKPMEGKTDEDAVPENVEPKTKLGDIYKLGKHRLMCGDSTDIPSVERLMDGEKADAVWTDPPYNVALGMETAEQAKARNRRTDGLVVMNDKMSDETFRQFLRDAYSSMAAVTKPGGSIYVAHADSEGYNFRGAARDAGWLVKQCLIWKKSSLVMGRQDYQWIHEPILYGWLEGGSHQWYGDRKQTTVMEFQKPSRNAEHPTMKPVELVEYCLNNSSKPQDIVLDLFGGSDTTLIASEKIGRCARLMELDPHYCDVIVKRWEDFTGNKAELLNG